ncbi:hypothetical protein F5887DRAFT_322542 [Amanita rubescens]|nr:hypothetical protein F5887DRAFT_322542 [Amanita rubescens]
MPEIFSRRQPDMRSCSSDIITGFQQDYHGMAVDAFLEYLKDNEEKYGKGTYYAKFCSIVQSSGTGKSRLLCELRKKDVIVLYMNIRDPGDVHAYPPQDTSPAKILTGSFTNEDNYTHRCRAFFTAIFTCLQEHLSMGSRKGFIKEWNARMTEFPEPACDIARDDFFRAVEKKYNNIFAQIVDGTKDGVEAMGNAFCSLHDMLMKREKPRGPFLVIAIDEAHELTDAENWRPSVVFCRAIADYSAMCQKCKCWVVFASTTSKVADFASPQTKYASARVPMGRSLFPPYTELGWDQMATPSNEIPADENAKLKYIRGFGRPLWKSIGNDFRNLKSLAKLKLAPGIDEPKRSQSDEDQNHLAVLAQRFGLDIYFDHKEATSLIENAIASRGRICLATTEDRTWSFTTYPSEPFLSCVAANILHTSPDVRADILRTMMRKVKIGLIEVGKTGELANRLIFLLGKDLYIRQSAQDFSETLFSPNYDSEDESDSRATAIESELFDCKMVPLIGYLEYLFGTSFWGGTEAEAKKLFANGYIKFSHWVPMKDNIGKRKGISPMLPQTAHDGCHETDIL